MENFTDPIIVGLLINVSASILVLIFARQIKKWVEEGTLLSKWIVFAIPVMAACVVFFVPRLPELARIKFLEKPIDVSLPLTSPSTSHWAISLTAVPMLFLMYALITSLVKGFFGDLWGTLYEALIVCNFSLVAVLIYRLVSVVRSLDNYPLGGDRFVPLMISSTVLITVQWGALCVSMALAKSRIKAYWAVVPCFLELCIVGMYIF